MNEDELLNLISHIDQSSLAYFHYEKNDLTLTLAKEMPQNQIIENLSQPTEANSKVAEVAEESNEKVLEQIPSIEETSAEGDVLTSPMVGVVYLQSAPDNPPLVNVDDRVEEGDPVVIIEAMKLMNEIGANKAGVITEIFVENETVVEFGQPLVRIK